MIINCICQTKSELKIYISIEKLGDEWSESSLFIESPSRLERSKNYYSKNLTILNILTYRDWNIRQLNI